MLSSKNVKDRERPWGFSSRDARKQALLDTAIGIGWDFVGGIGKLGGKVSGKAVEKLVSKIDKGIAKAAIRLGGNMLSEGVEEAVQTVLEPVFWAVATGESFAGVDLEEVVCSGLLGALSAGFIEGGGRNAKAELQVKDNGGSSAAGLRLLKSAQPASDAPLSLRGRSPWQSASSKAIDYRGTYDKNGTSGGTDSSLQAQNDPEVSNRNANLQAQRVNTEPSADTQAAGRGGGVEAYAKLLREVMTGTGSDVTGANRWSNGVAVQASGGKGRIVQGDAVSPTVKQPDRLGSRSLHALDGGADADVPVRQSDAGKFGVEQYGELLHQAGLDWDTAGKLSEIGLRIPSNIAESRNMAAPNVTAIPSGSMKAAGPQQRAVAADAEGYARRLQEVMPEFGVENASIGWSRDQTTRKYFYTTLNDSVAKHADGGKIELVKVSTDGNRNETPLTTVQIKNAVDYAVLLGIEKERIRYGDHYFTSYGSVFDMLYIGTVAYPGKNGITANQRITYKAAIAHEIIGHRKTAKRGTALAQIDSVLDEVQASIRAARFAPSLTTKERIMLLRDAITRLKKDGRKLRDIKYMLDIERR